VAPDDGERGIDWLASQLGHSTDEADTAGKAEVVAGNDVELDGDVDAASAPASSAVHSTTEKTDVAAPATGFGRRAGTGTSTPVETEPAVALPIAPPVSAGPAEPAGPAPWWTTPLPQRDEAEVEPEAATDEPTELLRAPGAPGEIVPAASTFAGTAARTAVPSAAAPSHHRSRLGAPASRQAALIWTTVGLLALIVLIGLFFLGQRLVASPVAAPVAAPMASVSPTQTSTSTSAPTPEITATQPAGVHEWNTLFGGECLEPYASPWEEDFTVVDCAASHTAQLVYRGTFDGDQATVFPGEAALAAQINLLCTTPGILDLTAAGAYSNLQVQGSYPITEEQWTTGSRNYFCFVSRASNEALAASIMGPGPVA